MNKLLIILLVSCKTVDTPLPIKEGRCFEFVFKENKVAEQWCQWHKYWWHCSLDLADHDTCARKEELTAEDERIP
jgi:hypothetical protein